MVRKRFHERYLKENHEVAGYIFNAFGLIYAVLIAFVVFATWSSHDTTKKNIEMEVNKLADLFTDASAFDNQTKNTIRASLIEYTKTVIEDEWQLMASGGKRSQLGYDKYRAIWRAYLDIDVKKIKNVYIYDESLRQLNAMSEYRRLRWFSSMSAIPGAIWLVLIVGGIISVSYTFFFGTKHLQAQCVMTSVYTIFNSMVLFLIYILDHPFTGYNAISNEPFRIVLRMFIQRLGQ
jgi:hypothetical protein